MAKNKKRARQPMQVVRSYDAARPDSRAGRGITPPASSVNAEVTVGGAALAKAARMAVRNDAFARRIVDLWAANAVGSGITCAWSDPQHAEQWRAWAETTACDAENKKTLAAIQALVMRAVVQDGECLVRMYVSPPTPTNPIGLRLQVLEADHLDRNKTGSYENRAIVQGVEIGQFGEAVAYWLLPRHPGDVWPLMPAIGAFTSQRIQAEYVLHIFRQERPGQVRGASWLAPVLTTLAGLKDYEAALLIKANIEACLSLLVNDSSEDTITMTKPDAGYVKDSYGKVVENVEPGMIMYRRGAGEIEVVNPSGGGSHLNFARRALERAAVGAGLTYDQVSGDLTGANYSSLRAGKIEFRALNSQVQWTLLLPQLCMPVAMMFHEQGVMAGLWPRDAGQFTHTPETPEMVDPLKDITAVVAQVRAGLLAPQDAAAMFGWEYKELIAKIAEADALRDDAGVAVDSDPRRLAKSGVAHDAAQIAAIEIAATGAAAPRNVEAPNQGQDANA